ncbi:PecA family PE domain-processing aspartic protease [Mycobacterium sp. 236(2023)]|uniref:PecA family PE domain-processing aspartic protease n=1 Tax=Mycobacterium sp. 236(2023) TaxID=3038163 RepID=UPI0024155CAD|nr:PecA family PE domain-processing aspartic protease [Mycobacterium sp. 236(2023)]MDG4666908.1 PecA family PE domain-processing aspartic protease [Mycobacterium sp. 236(2023)]
MWTATTAQAAPDDSSASSSADAASSSDDSSSSSSSASSGESRSTTKSTRAARESDDDGGENDGGGENDAGETDTEAAEKANEADAEDGDAADSAETSPASVPASARTGKAEALVTLDVADDADDADADEVVAAAADDDTNTVDLAVEQISEARDGLKAATWDSGNFLAGLASILPQMWLGGAQTSLERWQENHATLQAQYAATAENTFAHWIAGQRIEASIQRTIRAQDQLEAAEKFLPVVGLFGPREQMAALATLVDQASDNGLVYQILDVYMENTNGIPRINPIIQMSINGGEVVNVLLDTGSYGLVINPQVIGLEQLGPIIGRDWACFADCAVPYFYDVYNIPVTVNDDVTSAPSPVKVVTLNTWYALSQTNSDYQGILGIGPNSGRPSAAGRSNPLAFLPGLLGQGVLMDPKRNRAILGPNPYAARVTLDGAPINQLRVKIGDYDEQLLDTWVDTGGIEGSIPASLVNGATSLPNGTLITVSTPDGVELFSYRTSGKDTPSIDPEATDAIFGFTPFAVTPIYTEFTNGGRLVFNYK